MHVVPQALGSKLDLVPVLARASALGDPLLQTLQPVIKIREFRVQSIEIGLPAIATKEQRQHKSENDHSD
jgi:hypothetical protein